jgi:hypothetical protein
MYAGFIKQALNKRHTNDFYMCEVKTGSTYYNHIRIIDAIAIKKSWANPKVTAYEIKVSRQDFLRDNKAHEYLAYCNEFYFACPKDVIKENEVPEACGLIYVSDKGTLKIVKKAHHRDIEIPEDLFIYIIMSRIESDRYPFHESKSHYWRDWLDNKIEDRKLGIIIKSKLLEKINLLTSQVNKLEIYKRKYEDIEKVLTGHGIMGWNYLEDLKSALSSGFNTSINNDIKQIIKFSESLKRKMGVEL